MFQELDAAIKHRLALRKRELCGLYVLWERSLVGLPVKDDLPEWGPSEEEIVQQRALRVLGGGGTEVPEDSGYEYDVEFEAEADGLLIEHLDSLRITENYRNINSTDSIIT